MPFDPNQISPCGKTYAQIDADKSRYVADANEALLNHRQSGARWWIYTVSHSTFELVVGNPLGDKNIVLCLNACDRIAGPVSWDPQKLEVIFHCDRNVNDAWGFVIRDQSVAFEVQGGSFGWRENYNMVKYGSIYVPRPDGI